MNVGNGAGSFSSGIAPVDATAEIAAPTNANPSFQKSDSTTSALIEVSVILYYQLKILCACFSME